MALACNLGARHAQGKYLLFLNPDAALYKDTLSIAMTFMEHPENAKIGICGVQLIDENGATTTSAARFPTLRILAGRTFGLAKVLPGVFPVNFMSDDELNESKIVDQVIGAFFLIRKGVFDLCQGFDERFFVYFEEVDLSLRAKRLGYSSYFLSDARAFHRGGGCSDRVKAARLFYSLRSRVLYAEKHYSSIPYVLLIVLTAVELPLRLGQTLFSKSWSDARNTLIAYYKLIEYFLGRS
jgi:GT2 family glycosyltransferase